MKTIELIVKVKHLGLETGFAKFEPEVDKFDIVIYDKEGETICTISHIHRFHFNMDWYATQLIADDIKEELLRIVGLYASTPIDERDNNTFL